MMGVLLLFGAFSIPWSGDGPKNVLEAIGSSFLFFVFGAAAIAGAVYLKRGQGPTTKEVEQNIANEKEEAKGRRRSANLASFASRFGFNENNSGPTQASSVGAAQISAISNPDTARALQNLNNLLYTRIITDQEFKAAKGKILGPLVVEDPVEQIENLAALHRQGVLGDIEFSRAKARILGI